MKLQDSLSFVLFIYEIARYPALFATLEGIGIEMIGPSELATLKLLEPFKILFPERQFAFSCSFPNRQKPEAVVLPGIEFRAEEPSTTFSLVKLTCLVSVTLRKTMPSCSTTQACSGGFPLGSI